MLAGRPRCLSLKRTCSHAINQSAQFFVAGLKHSSALHSLAWGAPAQQSVLETWPRLPSLLLENVFGGHVNQAAHGSADAHARVVQWVCSLLDAEQDSRTFRKRKNMGVKVTPGNRHVPAEGVAHGLAIGKHHLTEQQITALLASYLSSAQHLGKGSSIRGCGSERHACGCAQPNRASAPGCLPLYAGLRSLAGDASGTGVFAAMCIGPSLWA